MMLNLATAFLAAGVVGLFSKTINQIVALAAFMPVIAGMGGMGGTQALTVVIRGIALGEVEFSTAQRTIWKELAVGATVGAATGATPGGAGFNGNPGWARFSSSPCSSTGGRRVPGAAVPSRSRSNRSALGSGVQTTFTDVIGFFVFLDSRRSLFPGLARPLPKPLPRRGGLHQQSRGV
jgi:magnesium transporter